MRASRFRANPAERDHRGNAANDDWYAATAFLQPVNQCRIGIGARQVAAAGKCVHDRIQRYGGQQRDRVVDVRRLGEMPTYPQAGGGSRRSGSRGLPLGVLDLAAAGIEAGQTPGAVEHGQVSLTVADNIAQWLVS